MSALIQWVNQLEQRVAKVEASRRAVIPPERYNSAAVLLEKLVTPFATLSRKHRFALAVTGSNAGVDLDEVATSLRRLLREEFQAFASGHLGHSSSGLGDQVKALESVIGTQTKMLDAHVQAYQKRLTVEMERVNVQVKLFKALSIANHTDDFKKVQLQFTVLTSKYGQDTSAATLESYRQAIEQALTTLRKAVTFDERLNLSQEALSFVQRILAGGSNAPTLLELTPTLLAEIQKLREFAGTVRILRAD